MYETCELWDVYFAHAVQGLLPDSDGDHTSIPKEILERAGRIADEMIAVKQRRMAALIGDFD